jgi:NAD(P)-dependent dehydrogenase (short-subunit alcohol dehydrogenase family)
VDLQLMGRRALVTGGSRGIGKAAAAALLAEGAEVAIAARDPGRLDDAAAGLGAAAGRAVPALQVDTGDDASVRRLVATVIAFLASPLSVSINGESIACGGGTPGIIRY